MLANTFLEDIESIVSARNNHDLINLSDWNPSNKFIQSVNAILPTSFIQNGIDYIFSSEINDEIKNKVKFKLGFGENKSLSIYFLNLPYNYFDEKTNIIKFIDSTAAYVIPNSRNHFPKSTGLSFRLNLCSVSEKYLYALERAIIYLGNLK